MLPESCSEVAQMLPELHQPQGCSKQLFFARFHIKNDFSKSGVWRNAIVTVGFAPNFCAKWYGRETHCFHGDHFRAKVQFLCRRHFFPTWWKRQKQKKRKGAARSAAPFGAPPKAAPYDFSISFLFFVFSWPWPGQRSTKW